MLLQFDNIGGPCFFFWQDLRIFWPADMAGTCHERVGNNSYSERLFWHLCQAVPEGVDNQLEAVGNVEF